ncbi:hypothetical protein BJF95_09795 [Rhizobium oryziradicis]|uniref:Uncharacterized protein n=1 Tax=Rhizobium oryziradicis TaxID=1867956 RepID=A0A1Q8ZS83_9HYPH|nr:hypothetical protein BJF95_09795 [Rhizobium oryziradicis]
MEAKRFSKLKWTNQMHRNPQISQPKDKPDQRKQECSMTYKEKKIMATPAGSSEIGYFSMKTVRIVESEGISAPIDFPSFF